MPHANVSTISIQSTMKKEHHSGLAAESVKTPYANLTESRYLSVIISKFTFSFKITMDSEKEQNRCIACTIKQIQSETSATEMQDYIKLTLVGKTQILDNICGLWLF